MKPTRVGAGDASTPKKASFCISVAEEDGEDDEEVAGYGQQAGHYIGHHVAEHYLRVEMFLTSKLVITEVTMWQTLHTSIM